MRDDCPARHYTASSRALPRRLPAITYPGYCEIRRVSSCGTVSWHNRALYLTEVLAGEDVAFEEVDDGIWLVTFATVRLARFDARTRALSALVH